MNLIKIGYLIGLYLLFHDGITFELYGVIAVMVYTGVVVHFFRDDPDASDVLMFMFLFPGPLVASFWPIGLPIYCYMQGAFDPAGGDSPKKREVGVSQEQHESKKSMTNDSANTVLSELASDGASRVQVVDEIGRCCWCKDSYPLKNLHIEGSGQHLLCAYCAEGLTAIETGVVPSGATEEEAAEKHREKHVIDVLLADAERDKNPRSGSFNGFINEANSVYARLYPKSIGS